MGQIAEVLQARGKTDEARAIWRDECLPVLRRLDEPRLVSLVLGRLGISHFESGDRDVAIRYFEEALPFAERSDHPATLGWVQEWLEIARRS
ncbi:MAG: tetratricopeptide repeat protein [Isosphaeraceae bacterium]